MSTVVLYLILADGLDTQSCQSEPTLCSSDGTVCLRTLLTFRAFNDTTLSWNRMLSRICAFCLGISVVAIGTPQDGTVKLATELCLAPISSMTTHECATLSRHLTRLGKPREHLKANKMQTYPCAVSASCRARAPI